jgi:hypothetical protein
MSRSCTPLPPSASMACSGTALPVLVAFVMITIGLIPYAHNSQYGYSLNPTCRPRFRKRKMLSCYIKIKNLLEAQW